MNIKITHNWLLEYLETDSTPQEIQKYLSLCGPSIERLEKVGDDYVFDIEIITNRIDTASAFGVAQEAAAILPMFEKRAKLKFDPLTAYRFGKVWSQSKNKLEVKIAEPLLCSRFTAVVLDNIKIKSSPDLISKRLVLSGIKSINNVVDISNYLMLALGQPVHVFDYDKIGGSSMLMRQSRKGEKITTLDGKKVNLPGGDVVIEDGGGNLIDLCGIMGGLNSSVTDKTKRVVLYVQTYNKERIRKTAMTTGVRTVAAAYFEKGLDEERVEPTVMYGIELLKKHAEAAVSSPLYDIYPSPYKANKLEIKTSKFEKLIGVKIDKKTILKILNSLGFITQEKGEAISVIIPSFRANDVKLEEDLVEEVARIYGYDKLPDNLPPAANVKQPEEFEKLFDVISKIKYFLKHLGLTESINYSMISEEMIKDSQLKISNHLKLANTISQDIQYMRTTLIPSLYKNIVENTGKKETLKFFEIGKIYLSKPHDLPDEIYKLAVGVNTGYFDLKGIIQALIRELNIEVNPKYEIIEKNGYFLVELDLYWLIKNYRLMSRFEAINPYAVIKLDKTFEISTKLTYEIISNKAHLSKLLKNIETVSLYKDKLSLRFYYSSTSRNITEEEAKQELEKI